MIKPKTKKSCETKTLLNLASRRINLYQIFLNCQYIIFLHLMILIILQIRVCFINFDDKGKRYN